MYNSLSKEANIDLRLHDDVTTLADCLSLETGELKSVCAQWHGHSWVRIPSMTKFLGECEEKE